MTPSIGAAHLIGAGALALILVSLSRMLRLGLEREIFLAAARTGAQLAVIGYALGWVFGADSVAVTLGIYVVMTAFAAQAAAARVNRGGRRALAIAAAALVIGIWPLAAAALALFQATGPGVDARFAIPFFGLLLGNSLSAVSLALTNLWRLPEESQGEIETFRALGASHWEARHRLYRHAMRAAMTPILNAMSVVGVVSLPGVMAGQILAGADPLPAALFQVVMMLLLCAGSFLGSLAGLVLWHRITRFGIDAEPSPTNTLTLSKGERLVIQGPSGAGKSRFLKALAFGPRDRLRLLNSDGAMRAPRILYLPQKPVFVPGTVRENVRLPMDFKANSSLSFSDDRLRTWLARAEMNEALLDQPVNRLSGGEAQLIHLFRALQLEPDLLLLDEPTSALDPARRARIEELLNERGQDSQTLVIVTHDPEQASRLGTRFARVENGILKDG